MKDAQLAVQGEQPLSLSGDPAQLISQAIAAGASVDVIERFLTMRRELKAEAAKEAFERAMSGFQSECPIIVKTVPGYGNNYRFAPLDHIVAQTKELIQKYEFDYTFTSEVSEGWVKAFCKVTHSAGHFEISEFKTPIDGNQKNLMSTPQRYGAAMTFTKRYAFCNAFGILTADQDTDAAPPKDKPVGESGPKRKATTATALPHINDLKKELWAITRHKHNGSDQEYFQYLIGEGFIADTEHPAELSAERLTEVIAKVKAAKKELF
jgi:hypothetical protein